MATSDHIQYRDTDAMKIDVDSLSPEALRGIIESFVLQEGTDYGEQEWSLTRKCERVLQQLHRGEAEIDFDPVTETVNVLLVRKN